MTILTLAFRHDDDLFYHSDCSGFVRNAVGVNRSFKSDHNGLALFYFSSWVRFGKLHLRRCRYSLHGQYNEIFGRPHGCNRHMKDFMMNQTQEDAQFFLEISRQGAMTRDELPLSIVVPSLFLVNREQPFKWALIFILSLSSTLSQLLLSCPWV